MSGLPARTLFIAGATGAVGRTVVRLCDAASVPIVPHLRPHHAAKGAVDPRAAVLDLDDAPALDAALRRCTTVLQLIGTMRKRFARGDTYASSDIGTTRLLCDAARRAGSIEHVVLLSSIGAGRPVGAYLQAKAEAERLVRDCGLPWTIFRPSAFDGEGHRAPPGMGLVARLPKLDGLAPIAVETLAAAILRAARERAPLGVVLSGSAIPALARS